MNFRSLILLLATACATGTLSASTSYSYGPLTNSTFYAGDPTTGDPNTAVGSYVQSAWTEDYTLNTGGGTTTGEQIVCVVGTSVVTDTCGNGGDGNAAHIPIYAAPTGTISTPNYIEVDGDPAYGAPVSTLMSGLTPNSPVTITFDQASNEEMNDDKAFNDNWLVYFIPSATTGSYICLNTVCTGANGEPAAVNPPSGAVLVYTSPIMTNTGAESTPWQAESFSFTPGTGVTSGILEFVTQAVATTTGFEPPFLDLAAITSSQGGATPEPGTWILTAIGAGLVLASGRLRRRNSDASKRLKRVTDFSGSGR